MIKNLIDTCQRCVVVAAHPDDEVLGAGGTIAKLVEQGAEVQVIYGTAGKGGRTSTPNDVSVKEEQFKLAKEIEQSCSVLGVSKFTGLELPDNRLDTVSRMDISLKIKESLKDFSPDLVLMHHYGDYNWDHTIMYDAGLMAFRSNFGDDFPRVILSYEVLSSSERSAQNSQFVFCPQVYVDISKQLDKKCKSLKCYQSELKEYPHPRSVRGVQNLAYKRGNEVGLEAAEAFQVVRIIS